MTTFLEQEIASQPDVIARLLDAEAARASEHDFRTDFDVQLERQWLPFVEVDVLDARLPGGVDLLALENFLVRVVEQAVERFLPNGRSKSLANDRRWRLARPESR